MRIQEMRVTDLRPNDYNFNEMDERQLATLTATVKRQGYVIHPIIARAAWPDEPEGFVVVDGEHQWRAAQAAGLETVPVQILEDATAQGVIAESYRRNGLRGNENRLKLSRAILRMQHAGDKFMSNVNAAKLLGKSEGWVRTTLMYGEVADMAAGRPDMPNESDIAKMTEAAIRELHTALKEGDHGPRAEADEDAVEGVEAEAEPEVKPTKLTKVLKALAKLDPEDRVEAQKALAKMVRQDAAKAKAVAAPEA